MGSMYEMIFANGENGLPLLGSLGFKSTEDIGRYRSAWLEIDDEGEPRIAVYTRNGGNNRETYMPDFSNNPHYLFDRDDDFDNTYATVYFKLPENLRKTLEEIPDWKDTIQKKVDMSENWLKAIDDIKRSK